MDCLSFVTEVGKLLWDPIKGVINDLVSYRTNIENFGNQVADLKAKKKDVENQVEESQRNLKEPTEEVRRWLERVNEIEESARIIQTEADEDKRWLKGLCPNWISRYNVSKEAAQMELSIKEQLQKEYFSTVSQPLPSVIPKPGNYVVGLESIERAKNHLMKLLDEENIRAIGVYGMGGAGKTTLMIMLNNELEEKRTFEKVIFVTVSENLALKRIQDDIAKRLRLALRDEDPLSDRAYYLSQRLKQEKTVLIILDDVWRRLEVSDVGIPSKTEHKGCKIVVTSRKESVCTQMDTNRNIEMRLLSEEESWALFKLKAGEVVDSPTLQHDAKMVMRECKGLPLAIVTVGLSLKKIDNKIIWREALRKLQSSVPTELEELEEYSSVISSLRFSYDFLEGGLFIRLYFLFCCLFPEDEEIDLKRLSWYGFGEDFLKVEGTLEAASNRGIYFAHRLKDSGLLLLDGDYGSEFVKMHDVVRDAAMFIAMKDGHGFFVRAGVQLEEWPDSEGNEEYKRISLMYNNIRVLPDELKRPKLQTLLLQGNTFLEDIPDNFFTWMPSLRVLDLSYTGIKSLPLSLSCLTNLRTLCMEDCKRLQDVSLLGGMEKLEILNLNGCEMIRELPLELCRLTNLKFLDLTRMQRLERIPFGVISKLTRLEILHMEDGFSGWDAIDQENVTGKIASFAEMASLNRLTDLVVWSKRGECLFQDMEGGPWRELNRFDIQVGEYCMDFLYVSDVRKKMNLVISSPNLANWIKVLLERAEELMLVECKDVESLEQLDVNLVGSNCLVFLSLSCCDQMKYIINFEKKNVPAAFANLQKLTLYSIPNLKKLWHGAVPSRHDDKGMERLIKLQSTPLPPPPPPPTSFTNLQELNIYGCDKLKNLFTLNLAGGLHKLHSLIVWNCKSMKELISKDDEKEEEEIKEEEEKELKMCKTLFPQLRKLDLESLSELTCFYSGGGGGGGRGGSGNMLFDFPSLETIHIEDCPKLKRLPFGRAAFANLQELKISDFDKLKNLFTLNLAGGLHKLNTLEVWNCKSMKELISKDDEKEEEEIKEEEEEEELKMCKSLFPQLQTLWLRNLSELTCFYSGGGGGGGRGGSGNMLFDFPSLEIIDIKDCPQLKRLPFGPHTAPKLYDFNCEVEWLKGLEWPDDDHSDSIRSRLEYKCRFVEEFKWEVKEKSSEEVESEVEEKRRRRKRLKTNEIGFSLG